EMRHRHGDESDSAGAEFATRLAAEPGIPGMQVGIRLVVPVRDESAIRLGVAESLGDPVEESPTEGFYEDELWRARALFAGNHLVLDVVIDTAQEEDIELADTAFPPVWPVNQNPYSGDVAYTALVDAEWMRDFGMFFGMVQVVKAVEYVGEEYLDSILGSIQPIFANLHVLYSLSPGDVGLSIGTDGPIEVSIGNQSAIGDSAPIVTVPDVPLVQRSGGAPAEWLAIDPEEAATLLEEQGFFGLPGLPLFLNRWTTGDIGPEYPGVYRVLMSREDVAASVFAFVDDEVVVGFLSGAAAPPETANAWLGCLTSQDASDCVPYGGDTVGIQELDLGLGRTFFQLQNLGDRQLLWLGMDREAVGRLGSASLLDVSAFGGVRFGAWGAILEQGDGGLRWRIEAGVGNE
ncbi:MAG: hypothetical protein KC561_19250, partial [Myxococcales bacterium]|nr:hypothetical protein [Myxococcales bacterium]